MSAELNAAGEVVATGLRETTTSIEAIHRHIARRAFGASGAPATPAHKVHDAIAGGVYASVRAGLTLGARGAGLLAAATAPSWTTPERERSGAAVQAALNGAFGDALDRDGSALAFRMAVRVDGADLPLTRGAIADAFPDASPRPALFLHGLCESDAHWRGDQPDGYGPQLAADLGLTPVVLRYNTGLRIAENGRLLAALLDALFERWPVPVDGAALIGHSMGGLVIRAACAHAQAQGSAWVTQVRTAVYLGTPHGGAPLEKGARLLAATLRRTPETRAVAAALDARSAGIHDLGDGIVGDAHVPLAAGIRHHAVTATIGGQPVFGHLFGDLLVRKGSASGRGSRTTPDLSFVEGDVHHVANANHFHLLNHPAVYAQLREWLAEPPVRRRTRAALPRGRG